MKRNAYITQAVKNYSGNARAGKQPAPKFPLPLLKVLLVKIFHQIIADCEGFINKAKTGVFCQNNLKL
jgi:hypothetical protein